jgi:hypothetical protein
METLLLINSNIDDHTGWKTVEYAKTRVAEQTGNFIVNGNTTYDEADYKFEKTTGSGSSLLFNGNDTELYVSDLYHAFNFTTRPFSIESWVKFDSASANVSKKHTIISKWSLNTSQGKHKIFRLFYEHDSVTPENSKLVFEWNGMAGYANENYSTLQLTSHSEEFDGEYVYDKDFELPEGLPPCKVWTGENGLLFMPNRTDLKIYDSTTRIRDNYIENNMFLYGWQYGEEIDIKYDNDDEYENCTDCWKVIGQSARLPHQPSQLVNRVKFKLEETCIYRVTFVYIGDSDVSVEIHKSPTYTSEGVVGIATPESPEFSWATSANDDTKIQPGVNTFLFKCDETASYGISFKTNEHINPSSIGNISLRYVDRGGLPQETIYGDVFLMRSLEEITSATNVSGDVISGGTMEFPCGNLMDDEWHSVYFASLGHGASGKDNPLYDFAVDGNFTRTEYEYDETHPTIVYTDNPDGSEDREEYLSSIQPHYETGNKMTYIDKLQHQSVFIGSDSSGSYLHGKLDTIRISEYAIYEDEESYLENYDTKPTRRILPAEWENVCKYDEHTELDVYEWGDDEFINVKIIEPTYADVDEPTTSFELYKKYLGSEEYLKKFWKGDGVPSDLDMDKWRWELKYIKFPMQLDMTHEVMKSYYNYLDRADEYGTGDYAT